MGGRGWGLGAGGRGEGFIPSSVLSPSSWGEGGSEGEWEMGAGRARVVGFIPSSVTRSTTRLSPSSWGKGGSEGEWEMGAGRRARVEWGSYRHQ